MYDTYKHIILRDGSDADCLRLFYGRSMSFDFLIDVVL